MLSVADVFTSLAGDRPYRKAMPRDRVEETLRVLAALRRLDADIVQALTPSYAEVERLERNFIANPALPWPGTGKVR